MNEALMRTLLLAVAVFATVSGVCALLTLATQAPCLRRAPRWEVGILVVLCLLGMAGLVTWHQLT